MNWIPYQYSLGQSPPEFALLPVRLATTCRENSVAAIEDAVSELLDTFLERNDCGAPAVQLAIFTATADLTAAKPAAAARRAGWSETQFLCLAEMPTDDDVPLCLRVLLQVYRGRGATPLKPVYLHGAQVLRPDLVNG
jgi:chorismate mutase